MIRTFPMNEFGEKLPWVNPLSPPEIPGEKYCRSRSAVPSSMVSKATPRSGPPPMFFVVIVKEMVEAGYTEVASFDFIEDQSFTIFARTGGG